MKIDNQKLKKEAVELGIRMIVLFGSQAIGNAGVESDFDVAVLTEPEKNIGKSLENYNTVLFFLASVFGIFENKIDLTNLGSVSPLLRKEIFANGKLIFGSEYEFASLKAAALRQYIATKSLRELRSVMINKRQELLREKIYG